MSNCWKSLVLDWQNIFSPRFSPSSCMQILKSISPKIDHLFIAKAKRPSFDFHMLFLCNFLWDSSIHKTWIFTFYQNQKFLDMYLFLEISIYNINFRQMFRIYTIQNLRNKFQEYTHIFDEHIGRFPIGIKTKIRYLITCSLIIFWGKVKKTTNNNYKISYFGFHFDWKST